MSLKLELKTFKSGISTIAYIIYLRKNIFINFQIKLIKQLPLILNIKIFNTIYNYSKGARGLSV